MKGVLRCHAHPEWTSGKPHPLRPGTFRWAARLAPGAFPRVPPPRASAMKPRQRLRRRESRDPFRRARRTCLCPHPRGEAVTTRPDLLMTSGRPLDKLPGRLSARRPGRRHRNLVATVNRDAASGRERWWPPGGVERPRARSSRVLARFAVLAMGTTIESGQPACFGCAKHRSRGRDMCPGRATFPVFPDGEGQPCAK